MTSLQVHWDDPEVAMHAFLAETSEVDAVV